MKLRKFLILRGDVLGAPLDPPLVGDPVAGWGEGCVKKHEINAAISLLQIQWVQHPCLPSQDPLLLTSVLAVTHLLHPLLSFARKRTDAIKKRYLILNLSVADPAGE